MCLWWAELAVPQGAFIFATFDGGNTWKQQHYADGESLLAMACVSATECFAGGADLSSGMNGKIYHTTDAGTTWTATSFPDCYIMDFSFLSAAEGYAVCGTEEETSVVLHYV